MRCRRSPASSRRASCRRDRRGTETTAIGYIRVSTSSQADGLGPELQEEAIRAWVKASPFHLRGIHRDEGVSGTLEERPALGEALRRLAVGDVLVVARLDRLARDLITQEFLLRDIRRRGADVASCAEGEQAWLADDPDDPSRRLIRQVLGSVAEYERAMISLRLRMARAHKRKNGGYAGGEPPFGWRRAASGGLERDEREQAVLGTMRQMRQAKHLSYRDIADHLNAALFLPRRGQRWTHQSVHRILTRHAA